SAIDKGRCRNSPNLSNRGHPPELESHSTLESPPRFQLEQDRATLPTGIATRKFDSGFSSFGIWVLRRVFSESFKEAVYGLAGFRHHGHVSPFFVGRALSNRTKLIRYRLARFRQRPGACLFRAFVAQPAPRSQKRAAHR